jgi:hypothetical protein
MPKNTEIVTDHGTYGVPDAENPEWTREQMAGALRFSDLPASLQAKLSAIQESARKKRAAEGASHESSGDDTAFAGLSRSVAR